MLSGDFKTAAADATVVKSISSQFARLCLLVPLRFKHHSQSEKLKLARNNSEIRNCKSDRRSNSCISVRSASRLPLWLGRFKQGTQKFTLNHDVEKLIPLARFSTSAKADSPVVNNHQYLHVQNMHAEFAKSATADLTVVKNHVYL